MVFQSPLCGVATLLAASLLLLLPFSVQAHRSIPSGITCGAQFSSPESPLIFPNPKISWANYNIHTCEHPITWYEAKDVDKDDKLSFTVLTPYIQRFANVRMTTVFIGPGLPSLPEDDSTVPDSVLQYASDNGLGGVIFKSPEDQSTCNHLTSEAMITNTYIDEIENRCMFHEPYSDSYLWALSDNHILAPQSASSYKIALYEENGSTAKASFACCDWPEDFMTPYDIPQSDCPACGSDSSENSSWTNLFYEHKNMAEYGGFPPLEDCSVDSKPIEYPSGDKCPPVKDDSGGEGGSNDDSDTNDNDESCVLGCNNDGECHSHNVFGKCTHLLDWDIASKFGSAPVNKVIIFKGDKIRFTAPTQLPHNLREMTDDSALEGCDFDESTLVADVGKIFAGHEVTFDKAGTFYYSCEIGSHCQAGQKLTVEVKDASDGLRCHDHGGGSGEKEVSTTYTTEACSTGLANARTVSSSSSITLETHQCADLCMPLQFLSMLEGLEQGTCSDLGYIYSPKNEMVRFTGSPMDTEITVVSKNKVKASEVSSGCHCHSYEKIKCPEEETADDTLYDEHIEEIETYCSGILEGSDDVCSYKCFQPMEVLHLHYLECPTRAVDPTYKEVDATNKCHNAAPAPKGDSSCEDDGEVLENSGDPSEDSDDPSEASNNMKTTSVLAMVLILTGFVFF